MRGAQVIAVRGKVLRVEGRQGMVAETNAVERAVDLEGGEVVGEVEFLGRRVSRAKIGRLCGL